MADRPGGRWPLFALALGLAAPALAGPALAQTPPPLIPPPLIPLPQVVEAGEGTLPLTRSTPLLVPPGDREAASVAHWLAGESARRLRRPLGPVLARGGGFSHAAIRFRREAGMGPEAYRLDITRDGATLAATTRAGLLHGAVTLWQWLAAHPDGRLPAVHITDAPRYPWRGLMLDSARHIQSVPAIERLIDVMALHKLNVLQWHLTDDQGWRLQIRRYPRLTQVGGWRRLPDGTRYGGYYTQAQARHLVAYAAARGITIVPEIEMPAHALAAIRAYPRFGFAGVPASAQSDYGIFPSIFRTDPATFAFLRGVLDEVMAIFPSHTIAIGGDEALQVEWHASAATQAQIRALGLPDEKALEGWFMEQMARYLADHGRRAIGWDDVLASGHVPADAAMLSWHNPAGAASALAAGHDVVMATDPTLYFDHRQSTGLSEPPGRGVVLTPGDVYAYDPGAAPAGAAGHVLGLQAQLWTEYMLDDRQMLAMAWPRAAALAERGWSSQGDWPGFAARLPVEARLLRRMDVAVTPGAFAAPGPAKPLAVGAVPVAGAAGPATLLPGPAALAPSGPALAGRLVSQQLMPCSNRVVLNLPGALPPGRQDAAARPRLLVDIMDRCWIVPATDLAGVTHVRAAMAALPFNYQLAGAEKQIVLPAPLGATAELVVRRDGCAGPELARLPLEAAGGDARAHEVAAPLAEAPAPGLHAVCVYVAARGPAPLWALDWIDFERQAR